MPTPRCRRAKLNSSTACASDGTAAHQGPGGVGVFSYLSGSATSGVTVLLDDLTARAP